MSISRIYQSAPLESNTTLTLDEKASHHLARVLRAQVGDKIVLFNGTGGEFDATIAQIGKKQITVEIHQLNERERESLLNIHLVQGIARGEKMDHIIQKAVELGVKKITPLITERCNVRLDAEREEKRLQHWRSVIISACEQCGRNRLPEIHEPITFEAWLKARDTSTCFILTPHQAGRLPDQNTLGDNITLVIGPEGGLSATEIELAYKSGCLPLNLGPRILRTETAALVAITVLQYVYGDLS